MKLIDNIAVYTAGDEKNPAIIFIHGFPFDASMWYKQVETLQKDYYCITYDIRGMGASAAGDGQYTIESFVDDLFLILDTLQVAKTAICGLSMGGYIVQRAVEREPHRFNKIILCDTRSGADADQVKLNRAANMKRILTEGSAVFVKSFIPNCIYDKNIIKLGDTYLQLLERWKKNSATGLRGCLLAIAARTDTTEFLEKISAPALVLCGEFDKFSSPEMMRGMAQCIPQGRFAVVPEAGHMAPLENPEFVNKLLVEFLKS